MVATEEKSIGFIFLDHKYKSCAARKAPTHVITHYSYFHSFFLLLWPLPPVLQLKQKIVSFLNNQRQKWAKILAIW